VNAVEFEHVSKSYPVYAKPAGRLWELLTPGKRSFHRDFQALRDVSFSVRRGEVFCIVGENGSGKSTALQIIAGILQPSSGRVQVSGRVAALLELGAGFNHEFTGRDNVYLNGSIMGLSKAELDKRFADIEDFAEIGAFIDQPLKTYSSGMVVRLAFAVAIHLDPEILIVDEALAVGDTYFRNRCMRKIHEMRGRGVTIVFVSHSSADIQAIGDRVLWLQHGRAVALGDAGDVLPRYLAAMSDKEGHYVPPPAAPAKTVNSIPNIDSRHGNGRTEIFGVAVLNEYEEPVHLMMPGTRTVVRIAFKAKQAVSGLTAGFLMRNHLGIDFAETSTAREGKSLIAMHAGETCTVDFELDLPEFYPGAFSFSPWIAEAAQVCDWQICDWQICDWIDNAITVQMGRGESQVYGCLHIPCRIEIPDPALLETKLA